MKTGYTKIVLVVIILTFVSGLVTGLFAQDRQFVNLTDPADMKNFPPALLNTVSVNMADITFEEAIKTIAKKGDFHINYNRDRIPAETKVSVKMSSVTALQALIKIMRDTRTGLMISKDGIIAIVPAANGNVNMRNLFSVKNGEINGSVYEKATGEPLEYANVVVIGTHLGSATDKNGRFSIPGLPDGEYTVEASYTGYESLRKEHVVIRNGSVVELRFDLAEAVTSLSDIIITPGHFSLMEKIPTSSSDLTADEIKSFPQMGEDIYRAVKRLPGLSGNDFSAKFNVRGGDQDEVLVMLDGMELYDPFHLKDIGGGFSIIDLEIINSVDMLTGAFPAEYGNRLSGVFNMKTKTKTEDMSRASVALSFLNARFLAERTFNNGKGSFQILGRRGYVDMVLKIIDANDNISPTYYDIFSKFQYIFSPDHIVSFHLLTSDDNFDLKEEDEGTTRFTDYEALNAGYVNTYGWLTWAARFFNRISVRTVLSAGRVSRDRYTIAYDQGTRDFESTDRGGYNFSGIRQDWACNITDRYMIKWGFQARNLSADYFYRRSDRDDSTGVYGEKVNINYDKTGTDFGAYFANRIRLFTPLVAEIGLRYDYASWTGDENISPRINLALSLTKSTVFRIGYGDFYQTQGISQLNVMDNDKTYYPAEKSQHYVAGVEQQFSNGISIRVEGYRKKLTAISPYYFNYSEMIDPTPDYTGSRVRLEPDDGESRGIEIYLFRDRRGKHSWWINYAWSEVFENIDSRRVYREYDQRHTINIDYNYRPNRYWSLNLSWVYHSGWPYTERFVDAYRVPGTQNYYMLRRHGEFNAVRLPAYHRMDVRLHRYFYPGKARISAFVEVRNLYNRNNVMGYDYNNIFNWQTKKVDTFKEENHWLPLIPSFGITADF